MGDFVHNIAVESWTLYPIGVVLIACRMYADTPPIAIESFTFDSSRQLTRHPLTQHLAKDEARKLLEPAD